MNVFERDLSRIAAALERIADALERPSPRRLEDAQFEAAKEQVRRWRAVQAAYPPPVNAVGGPQTATPRGVR